MASAAQLILHPSFPAGEVDPRLFGSFVEHLGRCVYGGVYEPGHPTATEEGFRGDVLELVRELGPTILRYPGGNFVSGYRWEDGVGPMADRPRRLDLAWKTYEPNEVGLNEFCSWARQAGTAVMETVNLGTRGPAEAQALVEYANHPGGSYWSDLRKSHGVDKPHDIRLWCLGNEMDGNWQMGAKIASEYVRVASEAAKMMRWTDSRIELVACGSTAPNMHTYPAWDLEVVEGLYDHADYLSLHTYIDPKKDRLAFLAAPMQMEEYIRRVISVCDVIRAKRRGKKDLNLAFDEYNVWRIADYAANLPKEWREAPPLLEDTYNVVDALVLATMMHVLLRQAGRVKIGCLAQLVNVIAPIRTLNGGPAWKQAIFHPFQIIARHGRGLSLQPSLQCETEKHRELGPIPILDAAAVLGKRSLSIFVTNRSASRSVPLEIRLPDLRPRSRATGLILQNRNPRITNTVRRPDAVRPRPIRPLAVGKHGMRAVLPPLSWTWMEVPLAVRRN